MYIEVVAVDGCFFCMRKSVFDKIRDKIIAKELGLLIDDIVGKMPEQRKMIYTLSRQEGLSNAEIAIQLNTTKRNVESQLSLALKEIRKAISCFLLSFL